LENRASPLYQAAFFIHLFSDKLFVFDLLITAVEHLVPRNQWSEILQELRSQCWRLPAAQQEINKARIDVMLSPERLA